MPVTRRKFIEATAVSALTLSAPTVAGHTRIPDLTVGVMLLAPSRVYPSGGLIGTWT
jgi:hypothetical protein